MDDMPSTHEATPKVTTVIGDGNLSKYIDPQEAFNKVKILMDQDWYVLWLKENFRTLYKSSTREVENNNI